MWLAWNVYGTSVRIVLALLETLTRLALMFILAVKVRRKVRRSSSRRIVLIAADLTIV